MKFRAQHLALPAALAFFACAGSLHAQGPAGYVANGRVTGRIASAFSHQNLEPADQATTKKVRDAIAADASLSEDARRIQISTSHGRVTLLGDVQSDNEKSVVLAKATAIVGEGNVENRLDIVPAKS
ncbi:MAG TPA: BON domain-containing protein [Candidatus Acidoferrales bacterium]|nr:BON domain-containing protein [Candidatus Acidoferrales bacterium]